MRRPVRSQKKVSNRKLFNNGGFPTMGAQAQMPNPLNVNMGGTLPQANNIMAPSGILASSTELSNAVGDQALAQSFAPTVGMKSGGIASFANGGGNTSFPGQQLQDYTMEGLNKLLGEIGVRAKNVGGRLGTTANYLQSYVPPVLGGKAFTPAEPVPVESTIDATTYGAPFGVTKDFEWETVDPVNNTTTIKDFTFADIRGNDITARNWFNEPAFVTADRLFKIRGPEVGLEGVIKNMVDSLPNLENEIVSISQEIIARDPNIEKDDLRQQVSVALKTITEGNNPSIQRIKQEGAANLYQDTQGQDTITLAESIDANKTPVDEVMEQMQDVSDYETRTIDDSIVGENEIETDVDLAVSRWKATGYDNNFIETLRGEGKDDAFLSEVVARKELDYASPELGTKFYKDLELGEEEALKVDIPIPIPKEKVDETDGTRDNINIIAENAQQEIEKLNERNKALANKPATEANVVEAASNAGEEIFVQQARGDEQETINETLDRFAKEFMDRMPEFKGKTESEKGWDLIMLGSAIMGGTSPNALTNIANGFLATGDRFTEDDKAKRVYNNSIEMGAAKYSLQKLATMEARKYDESKTPPEMFVANENVTYDGKEYSAGDVIPITITDLKSNGVPSGVTTPELYAASAKIVSDSAKTQNKILSDLVKSGTITQENMNTQADNYKKITAGYEGTVAGNLYLSNAINLFTEYSKEISGAEGVVSDVKDKVDTFFGGRLSKWFKKGTGGLSLLDKAKKEEDWDNIVDGEYTNAKRQMFISQVKLAFQQLIPAALAGVQSANSISNRDVQFLADAFIGGGILNTAGTALSFSDPSTILYQLNATKDLFDRKEKDYLQAADTQFKILQSYFKTAIPSEPGQDPYLTKASYFFPRINPASPDYIGNYKAEKTKQNLRKDGSFRTLQKGKMVNGIQEWDFK